tara:strand:- start:117 stop:770 length:654 start_codon:yes stop_codon:yes gene_type:complete
MSELSKRFLTSLFLLFIIILSFISIKILCILIFIVNFLVIDEFVKIFSRIYKRNIFKKFLTILLVFIYMTYFSLVIYLFLIQSFSSNKLILLFLLVICASTDIGGFFFGKLIGGMKITKISPNKTFSGFLGSIILSLFLGYIYFEVMSDTIKLNINLFYFIIMISFISQIGDLVISYFKRLAKIKDTGSILPGHGGILDRIDGMLLALPLGIIIYSL